MTEISGEKKWTTQYTNYAFLNDNGKGINQDPITGVSFDASNMDLYENKLLELKEAQSENTERISCMEEVHTSEGYVTEMYLNSNDNLIDATKIKLTVDGDELMKLFYVPVEKLILVNKKGDAALMKDLLSVQKPAFLKQKNNYKTEFGRSQRKKVSRQPLGQNSRFTSETFVCEEKAGTYFLFSSGLHYALL